MTTSAKIANDADYLKREQRAAIKARDEGIASLQRAALDARDRGLTASREAEDWFHKCGLYLRELKAGMPHGQFLPWCKANEISPDQAQRWMREAASPAKREDRQAKNRAAMMKSRTRVQHLPPSNFEPEAGKDDLPEAIGEPAQNIIRAFKLIRKELPKLTIADRKIIQGKIPKACRKAAEAVFFEIIEMELCAGP
jgi:hypothetical protein